MRTLIHQRCLNHASRGAAVLCPECRRPFCRECVTEHEDRILCASCLDKILPFTESARGRFLIVAEFGQFLAGFSILWFVFYHLARILLAIPSSFHEGTVWREMLRVFE